MTISKKIISVLAVLIVMGISACATEKPASQQEAEVLSQEAELLVVEATVEEIDYKTRKVTLKDAEGELVTITASEEAGKLDHVKKGDILIIEYLESVEISILRSDAIAAGATGEVVIAEPENSEKPAKLFGAQIDVILTVEAIDLENETVTLKDGEGNVETVKPRNPENLKKGKVGDKVKITVTEIIGYQIKKK
ncbi:MAG: hypothetical protein KAG92_05590 [Deltaproteobacteria bacterium]|nr:hypothetical protein [Deltaproteobacteria bacterium]